MFGSLVLLALVVVVVTGTVSGHQQIIYVDTQNGTLDSSCWDSGTVLPCANLELALEGAQKRQSDAVVKQHLQIQKLNWSYCCGYSTRCSACIY